MHILILVSLTAIVVQNVLCVQPGDPFPLNRYRLKLASYKSEIEDPHDDAPLNLKQESKHPIENRTMERKSSVSPHVAPMMGPIPMPISKNNLIRINRWKFEDMIANEIRYWYEPDGAHMGKGWIFDRVAFLAYSRHEPGTKPVFSFHSETAGEWTNTLQLDSTPLIRASEQWISDGISFYTYPTKRNSPELQPVWRYWNAWDNETSFTTKKSVTLLVINTNGQEQERIGWIRDQILFYALPFEV